MPRHTDQSRDGQDGRAAANRPAAAIETGAAPPLIDYRPSATAPQTLQAVIGRSPRAQRLAQLQVQIDNSPRQSAQRRQLADSFGAARQPHPVRRATPTMQAKAAGSPHGSAVLQLKGVGGPKIGFKQLIVEGYEDAWGKLAHCWRLAKTGRQIRKENIEEQLESKVGKGGFAEYYAGELDKIKDERDSLIEVLGRVGFGPTVTIAPNNDIKVVTSGDGGAPTETLIGQVITDANALYTQTGVGEARETFKKQNPLDYEASRNKEYIKDSRGVYTRRFAYHEMNYHQMMDFVMSGELTGRYQMFMSAGEAASTSPRNIVHDDTGKVTTRRDRTDLTWEEVAVLHQWKGSGPYQSGVSLTSTPREEVRSNEGGRFRTKGGFKLKIDLAKVALETPIINDYSAGGVAQSPTSTTKTRPKTYQFPESATKNREVYIDRVKKDWVVEVTHHGDSEVVTTFAEIAQAIAGGPGARVEVAGIGIQAYIKGFEEGMKGNAYNAGGAQGKLGAEAGQNALAGYRRGSQARLSKGGVATPADALRELVDYEQVKVPKAHKYDAHKIGYMRGRCTTKPMFASAAEYGQAISK
jgi:hypothetical protein